jgi:hypothetical protein
VRFSPSPDERIDLPLYHRQYHTYHSTMPARTRPIEKFAEATAKCSPEVRDILPVNITIIANLITGRCIWQMHRGKLPERTQGHVC